MNPPTCTRTPLTDPSRTRPLASRVAQALGQSRAGSTGILIALAIITTLLVSSPLAAQNSLLKISSTAANTGDAVALAVSLDHLGPAALSGWSFGVCHDPLALELTAVDAGSLLSTVNAGSPPDFLSIDLETGGFTEAVVICFSGCATLPVGFGHSLNTAHYVVHALAPANPVVSFCSTLGMPPVALLVATRGQQQAPAVDPGDVTVNGPPARRYLASVGDATTTYDPGEGLALATLPVLLVEDPSSPGRPNPVAGFELSITHQATYLTPTQVEPGPALQALNGGLGPDFFSFDLLTGRTDIHCLTASIALQQLLCEQPSDIVQITYQTLPGNLLFNFFGIDLPIGWQPAVASPVPNRVTVTGQVSGLDTVAGQLSLVAREKFRRGDANDDGNLDIADALTVLALLFQAQPIPCDDAADANDSGALDIADAITLLTLLFGNGPPLPAPFPGCGFDPTGLDRCGLHSSCP